MAEEKSGMIYAYKIAFLGNGGFSYYPWNQRLYRRRELARAAARDADGMGRRWGSFIRRVVMPRDERLPHFKYFGFD